MREFCSKKAPDNFQCFNGGIYRRFIVLPLQSIISSLLGPNWHSVQARTLL